MGALAEPRLMANISDLNVKNVVSNAIVDVLYPDWRSDAVAASQRIGVEADDSGSFNFAAGGIGVTGYYGAKGYEQVAAVRAACRSRGTAEDGTFACLNQLAAVTCLHSAVTLAAGFTYDQVVELLFGSSEGKESKEKPPKSRRRQADNIGIKHTGHACTLFPRGQAPYINNIWSQMGEIAFAEASALYIQWTMYDKASGNVYIPWHSELDTVASDICPLYVSGSGCKF